MFSALLRTRMLSIFSSFGKNGKNKAAKRTPLMKLGFVVLIGYLIFWFIMIFGMMFQQLTPALPNAGLGWFYYLFAATMAFALMFVGSIFMTQSQLFEAKDNELLLAMPIKPKYILLSRIITLYIYTFVFEILVMIPATYLDFKNFGFDFVKLVYIIAFCLIFPLLSLTLSCAVGWIIATISSHMRNKSLVVMVLSIGFLCGYFYVYSKMNDLMNSLLINASTIAGDIKGAALPLYWIGSGLQDKNALFFGYSLLMFVVPFLLVYYILSMRFIKLVTTKRGAAKRKYREKSLTVSSADGALLRREVKHFLASPVYMMNGGLGIIFTVISAVIVVIKRVDIEKAIASIPILKNGSDETGILLAVSLALVSSMNILSAPSISLEGNKLWIIRSFPVDSKKILLAKVKLHLVFTIPASLLAAVIYIVFIKVSVFATLMLILLPNVLNVFFGFLGVLINLAFPKLDAISETAAIKQSMSTMMSMVASMIAIITPTVLYAIVFYKMISITTYTILILGLFVILDILMYYILITAGKRKFEKL